MRAGECARRFLAHLRRSLPSLSRHARRLRVLGAGHGGERRHCGLARRLGDRSKFATIALLFGAGRRARLSGRADVGALRLARENRPSAAFAACFLGLSLSTIGVTAVLYAFDYRQYYSAWHEEMFTVTWMFQFVFTTAVR